MTKLFKDFLLCLLDEQLTDKQKELVNSWKTNDITKKISNHVFNDKDRIEIPYENAPKNNNHTIEPDYRVESHLNKYGYKIKDYLKGTAIDKYDREVNIGKVLNKTKAESHILNAFTNDSERQGVHLENMKVVVSRHPHDIAGASTDRSWNSCLNMSESDKKNNQSYQLEHDIKNGSHVAYLVKHNDNDIKKPVARVLLKPFHSEDSEHTILRPEQKVYGASTRFNNDNGNIHGKVAQDLLHTMTKWTEKYFPVKPGEPYRKDDGVYDDDGKTMHYDTSQKSLDKIAEHPDEQIRYALTNESNDYLHKKLLKDKSDYIRQNVARKTQDIEHLMHLAGDTSHKVREIVALRGHKHINNDLINDEHPSVRSAVAKGGHETHLNKLLKDPSPRVRKTVAEYGKEHHARELAYDNDDNVAQTASAALADHMRRKK